ncbi:hypothetical protein [Haloarcula sp. JP-L23]|uniref:hypothetical protein n=1 Tax=Haloarcula sp. JP-L23 TaxID=2716717 RepID=UPI00140EDB0E|nr:hypothetical protein G9465_12415 [Haloarcula sp. JP-L23]
MNQNELEKQLSEELGCSQSNARIVAEKATALKERVDSNPESWDGPEIDSEYIISRLEMAPEQHSITGKWNWWTGSMDYFGGTPRDYRIK